VGNPVLAQVREFIDEDQSPPKLDPVGIVRRALRGREHRVITLVLIVATLAAIGAYLAIQPAFQSSGMLRVLPREGKILYSDSDDSRLRLYDAFVTAEMQLLTSRPVLEAALQHLHSSQEHTYPLPDDVGKLASMVNVAGKKGLISLAARSGNPRLSAATVNAVIAAYEESNEAARRRHYDVRREELSSRESNLEKALSDLNDRYLEIGGEHDLGTLSKAHVAKTAQLEVLEERLTELDNTIAQLQSTGVVDADVGNSVEIQRSTLLDQAMADMTYERAQRLAALETLKARYQPSHPTLRSAVKELAILEGAIAERRDQIAMLGKAGALTGSGTDAEKESLADLQVVKAKLTERRQDVRSEAAELNTKLIRIRGVATEKDRLEELLAETKRALDEVVVESQNDLSRAIEIIALGKVPQRPIEDKRKPAALGAAVFSGLGTLAIFIGGIIVGGRVRYSDDLDERSADALAAVIEQSEEPAESFAEAARGLRNELDLRWPQQESQARVIGIVGTGRNAGVSSITYAFGINYARAGLKVLLIDADTDSNGLTRLSGATGETSVAAVARGDLTLEESVVDLTDGNNSISLLPSGESSSSRDAQRLNNEMTLDELRRVLRTAQAGYDVIILDLGRLNAGRQSAVGAALAERTVLVAPCGCLRKELSTAQGLLTRLASSGYLLALNRANSLDPAFSTPKLALKPMSGVSQERLKNFLIRQNGV
jgi:Mrp family chromosome partitioning ATPase/uncharacterized protein involved in exopolysaccharide biosynthesis